ARRARAARCRAPAVAARRGWAPTAGGVRTRPSSSYPRSPPGSRSSMARHASRRREGPRTPSAGGGGCSAALVGALGGLVAVLAGEALPPARGGGPLPLGGGEGVAWRAGPDAHC